MVTTAMIAVVLALCGCRRMEAHGLYRQACRVVESAEGAGPGVVAARRDAVRYSIGKNAARLDVPYYRGKREGTPAGLCTVWFKRIRLRWEVDRAFETPRY